MNDQELDRGLAARLRGLASAVPVDGSAPLPGLVTAPVVRGRTATRARASVSALGIIAILGVLAAVALRPTGIGGGGPVTASATDGPFRLTLSIPQARYAALHEITGITASLTYAGPEARIPISTSAAGPIAFAVAQVGGSHGTSPVSDDACRISSLEQGVAVDAAFSKSGAIQSPDDPEYPWFSAYFARPGLQLEAGRWTITAVASFQTGAGCTAGADQHVIRASATIEVSASSAESAASAAPTPNAAASAGSAEPTPTAAPTPTVLPSAPGSPGPSPSDAVAPCAPDEVTLTAGTFGAAAGTTYLNLTLDLVGSRPCRWPLYPAISLRDATGAVIAQAPSAGNGTAVLSSSLPVLFGWASWCSPPPAAPVTLEIALDTGAATEVKLPAGFRASCMDVPTIITIQVPGY